MLTAEDKAAAVVESERQGPSKFVDVSWDKQNCKWKAAINHSAAERMPETRASRVKAGLHSSKPLEPTRKVRRHGANRHLTEEQVRARKAAKHRQAKRKWRLKHQAEKRAEKIAARRSDMVAAIAHHQRVLAQLGLEGQAVNVSELQRAQAQQWERGLQ